jgi:hypothetical protein
MSDDYAAGRYVAEKKVKQLAAKRLKLRAELHQTQLDLEAAARFLSTQYGYNTRQIGRLVGISHVAIARWVYHQDD